MKVYYNLGPQGTQEEEEEEEEEEEADLIKCDIRNHAFIICLFIFVKKPVT